MALVSPGVEVTVIDESQYIPSAVNTVPYFVIATAQNKVSGDGITVAAGTTAANANKTYLITSQRDLVATFGVPFFYNTTTGTPINGYELNEYGLLAAYSALGVTNRAYVQRANIDLTELTASLSRPTDAPADGTFWLDSVNSTWGIQEWNQTTGTFTAKTPLVLIDSADMTDWATGDFTPLASIGNIGDYAVTIPPYNTASLTPDDYTHINGWYKNSGNVWVLVGDVAWQNSWPTVTGTNAPSTASLNAIAGAQMTINDSIVTLPAGGVSALASAINAAAITGITAAAVGGKLAIYADRTATNDGSTLEAGVASLEPYGTQGGALFTALGLSSGEFPAPQMVSLYSYQVPNWRTTGPQGGAPTGSVWNNISQVNNGTSIVVKRYSATLGAWVQQDVTMYNNLAGANYALDPSGGGKNIPVGTIIVQASAQFYLTTPADNYSFVVLERAALGATVVTGTVASPTFVNGNSFSIFATEAGTTALSGSSGNAVLTGTTPAAFCAAVSAANVPNVSASVNSAGNIVITHSQGGSILLQNVTGTPVTTAGFTDATPFCFPPQSTTNGIVLSNWVTQPDFTYTASDTAPDVDPADGRLWYYSSVDDCDIMINTASGWRGYQNVTNDIRGYDLSLTNANGPIVAPTAPTTQNNAALSALEYGDLWVDSSDLENYPKIYRWQSVDNVDQWVAIDTTDQVTENGILFADARWAPNGTTDPVADPFPTIVSLLTSNYLDLDAPDHTLYPQGMLLWNTRRSGYNVKSFQVNYFNSTTFPDDTLPSETNTWLTASGNKDNGSMYSGRQAQRKMVVAAMKSGIDTSVAAREEQNGFNIISTPAYPELIPNMIALSNERGNTLFVVGDTPMRLGADGNSLVAWATNNNGLGLATGDGQVATSNYCATFYPSCQTTDLSGNTVVAPPSHMMVRTILRSDAVSYPWLAPAGTRRGVVDNATAIGYIDSATGEFQTLSVGQAVRDILYERNVNPITFIPGVGITNFGNKTSTTTTTALDRINVARLICFLRGRLEEIGKLFLFEPNDQITRNEITNTVNSLMIDLIAKRAIYDYLVVCDLSNNTPARIDRNELWVDIAIEPVKAVEFIYIPLRIKNTGEISGGAAG
jgi:hypothetical protein